MRLLALLYSALSLVKIVGCRYGYIMATGHMGMAVIETEDVDEIPHNHLARALYQNQINETGWAFLEVTTNGDYPDELQARAAGFLEGYLCRDLIWMHYLNVLKGFCADKLDTCEIVDVFLDKNEDYVMSTAKKNLGDPYWYQVLLYYKQLRGVALGYQDATVDPEEQLTVRDIFWLNAIGDLDELAYSLWLRTNHSKRAADADAERDLVERYLAGGHCTGLVKLLPDFSDLFLAQTTWNSYQSMLRLQKLYVLNFRESRGGVVRIPGYKMSMSSYPGIVQSLDDFYIISTGLVVAETTIGNSRRALFKLIKPRGQILEFVRTMVANRLATSGGEWVRMFSRHNSGTYNNQWYIVDYKLFEARSATSAGRVSPGLLWVLEQLPGTTEYADLTNVLKHTSYFPSYNMPYFPRIFRLSGGPERVQTFGDWFGQHTNPRFKMLKKLQAGIFNMRDMFYTMRYNDFKHDPLSRCEKCVPPYSGCNAVAARNDLNPANGTYPFRALGHRSHGATDTKITSAGLRPSYQFVSVSGPPYNRSRGIPPFTWSEFDLGANLSHVGHPDAWVFPPLRHRWWWAGK